MFNIKRFLPKIFKSKFPVKYGGKDSGIHWSRPLTLDMICKEYLRRLRNEMNSKGYMRLPIASDFLENENIYRLSFKVVVDRYSSLDDIVDCVEYQMRIINCFGGHNPFLFHPLSVIKESSRQMYDGISMTCYALSDKEIDVQIAFQCDSSN